MAMNVGPADGDEDEVVSTINTTPLVDVMLVLLIIFLITIPVVTTSIPVAAAEGAQRVRETKPENIMLSVDANGSIYWNDLRIADTNALVDRLKKVAVLTPQPEVQIRGDGGARLRRRRQGHLRVPARRHRQGRLHHRAAAARRLTMPTARIRGATSWQ